MKYEIKIKSEKGTRVKLKVKYHGKTFIESIKVDEVNENDNYDKEFKKRINSALGKGSYKKLMKRLDKDFDI